MAPLKKIPGSWWLPFLAGNALMFVLMAARFCGGRAAAPNPWPVCLMPTVKTGLTAKAAAWGRIEASQFPLAGSDRIESLYDRFMAQPKWKFQGVTRRQLARYFLSLELPFRERQQLLDPARWRESATGIEITPPDSAVYALDIGSRSHIYMALAQDIGNDPQLRPIILPRANLDGQLLAIGLNPSQVAAIRQLAFTRGDLLCFSDFGVAEKVLGERAFENFVEYIFAVPATKARLKIDSHSDIAALAAYWGRGGREELITPLLKSLARVPGGSDINVSALLPDFARLRLYCYPEDVTTDGPSGQPDCFYSAMNFFNPRPDAGFFDPAHVTEVLQRDYETVAQPGCLGDIIMLVNGKDRYMHACVFITGDLVFTKNGITPMQPWTLMRLDDVLGLYYADKSTAKIQTLRKKSLNQQALNAVSPG